MNQLTVGIPTTNRYHKLKECLDSFTNNISIPVSFIIVDSSSVNQKTDSFSYPDNAKIIYPDSLVSPSHARKIIADNCNTEFLLYLDDDMTINKGSIEILLNYLKRYSNIDIVGGAVNEYGFWRDIGFFFILGERNDKKFIEKKVVTRRELELRNLDALRVDLITQPPFLMRTSIFNKVNFDTNYKWAIEIYDFFYQCYLENITSMVIPEAKFNHFPSPYRTATLKHNKIEFNIEGRKHFQNKWSVTIRNPKRRNIFLMFYEEWLYRREKYKAVKKKIILDDI